MVRSLKSMKQAILRSVVCALLVMGLLAAFSSIAVPTAHAAPSTPAGSSGQSGGFEMAPFELNDLAGGHSLLQGSRTPNASPYRVTFTVGDMATAHNNTGCFNAWVTMLHNDANHNDALRIFCNRLELHMHNGPGTDYLGPVDHAFRITQGQQATFLMTVIGQDIKVYLLKNGLWALTLSWDIPANEPNVSQGRSVVAYVAGGTDACWDNFSGNPIIP